MMGSLEYFTGTLSHEQALWSVGPSRHGFDSIINSVRVEQFNGNMHRALRLVSGALEVSGDMA